jgi:hypothetical protein
MARWRCWCRRSPGRPLPDLQATVLHQFSIHHEKLTFRFQGRDFRLTDVHNQVVKGIIS